MRIFLTITLLLLATKFLPAQNDFTFNQGHPKEASYFSVISYENIRGKIILKTVINEKSYRFILDTGAPTTISKHLYNELKPTIINRLPVTDQSGKVDSLMVVSLKEITVGDVPFIDIPTLVAERTLILECFQADGFIGSNLLRNSVVQFHALNNTITITNNEKRLALDPKQSSELFLDRKQSSPYVWIKLKSKKKGEEQLLFDSGMDGFYDLSLNHYKKIFEERNIFEILGKARGSYSMGLSGTANDTVQFKLRLPSMEINGTELRNVSAKTTTSHNSRIGIKLLEHGIVTIDYKNKRFYFSASAGYKIDLLEKSFPIDLVYRNGQMQVGIVWSDTLKDEIKAGDQVMAVDDVSYADIDICGLMRNGSRLKGRVTLTVKNEAGKIEKVVVEER
jgi:predicted aspartyl protease